MIQELVKLEREANKTEQERLEGTPVLYGSTIQV